jgi:hypothetical protein
MFDNKEDLYDFLLTNDFNEKYSDIEYNYFLLGFKSLLREMYSEKSNLKSQIFSLNKQLEILNIENDKLKQKNIINNNVIKYLHNRLNECIPWYKKIFLKR